MGTLMESWPRRHRITVDDYHRMAEVGVLAPDARVELVDGEIFDMAPIGKEHGSVVDQLNRLFVRAVGDDAIVRVRGSVRLDVKVPLYARHGVPEAWIVDLQTRQLLVYCELGPGNTNGRPPSHGQHA